MPRRSRSAGYAVTADPLRDRPLCDSDETPDAANQLVGTTAQARLERGVFAEIGADPRATRQGLGIVLAASLLGGWRFLRPGDGEWHLVDWLLDEADVAIVSLLAASAVLWAIARPGGGRGSVIALAFAIAPIVFGAFGFRAQLIGAALATPLFVRAVAETQSVRTRVAIVAVATPVLLYAAFFAYVALVLD